MAKTYIATLMLILSLPAVAYPSQAIFKLKAKDLLQRLAKLSEGVSVSVCQDRKGYVTELSMYGGAPEGGRGDLYREMKGALDATIPKDLRGKMLGIAPGRLPSTGCCDSFLYAYERVVIEEVLMHGRYYEIKVRVGGVNRPRKD